MFFVNRHIISKGLNVDLVFVDDTSCTNTFALPLISTLCRSECGSVHTVAWGLLKNRTIKSFERFFTFLHKHHPGIRVFVCDRHHAQSRAIATVFGGGVHIISCCVHLARNITRNTGPHSTLVSLFWRMRFERSAESEEAFLAHLERAHRAKKTMFTTRLLASTASFLPSKIDHVLRRDDFPVLSKARSVNIMTCRADTPQRQNAIRILRRLQQLQPTTRDIFSCDNTNTIESHFNVIKGRIPKTSPRLLDVFNAVTFTESAVLSQHNIMSPVLPDPLIDCLLCVVSPDVLNVMTRRGVESFLGLVVDTLVDVVFDGDVDCGGTEVERLIRDGGVFERFGWMPDGWVISEHDVPTVHDMVRVEDDSNVPLHDVVPFLEPFIDLATRSVPIFQLIQTTFASLYELSNDEMNDCTQLSFQFLMREFEKFVALAENNAEMKHVLVDLCSTLKRFEERQKTAETESRRKRSIADPGFVRVVGPQAKSTSSKVDGIAPAKKTRLVEQLNAHARRDKKPIPAPRRMNACAVCLGLGHQARTCQNILLDANTERATMFFRTLVSRGKDSAYVSGVGKRVSPESLKTIADRIKAIRDEHSVVSATGSGREG